MTSAPGGSHPPFFLVAGMFGNVLNLRHLAVHLGTDQPVYAVQARGLRGEDRPHTRFEEMAADYLKEIRSVQPSGPYFLGGFSGGGLGAWEMAQQLLDAGEEVALLVLLDSIPPQVPDVTRADRLRIHLARMADRGPAYFATWIRNRVRWEMEKFGKRNCPEAGDVTPAEFRSEAIEAAFREALAHYQIRPYPRKVVLFRPPLRPIRRLRSGRLLGDAMTVLDPSNHWGPLAPAGVEVHEVGGDHDRMVLEPHVRGLAARLARCLAEARECRNEPSLDPRRASRAEDPMTQPLGCVR